MVEQEIQNHQSENRTKCFVLFFITAAFLVLTWFVFNSGLFLKIITGVAFIAAYIIFEIKNQETLKNTFLKFANLVIIVIISLFLLIYVAFSFGYINIGIGLLVFAFIMPFIFFIIVGVLGIIKSSNILPLIVAFYVLISLSAIILSGYMFAFVSGFEKSGLIGDNKEKITDSWSFIYFSSSVYYSNSLGEITPVGYARLFMQIESALSCIFHVIILGFVVGSPKKP